MSSSEHQTELTQFAEQYKCVAVSTGHLHPSDINELQAIVSRGTSNMITERDTGFFVKLYGVDSTNNRAYGELSDSFYSLISEVQKAGYLLVEFDSDAMVYSCFPLYEAN